MTIKLHSGLSRLEKLDFPMHEALLPFCNAFLRLPISRRYKGIRRQKLTIREGQRRVRADLYAPKALEGRAPCLVYFHGGGFALRAAPQHYKLAQVYCEEAPCRVLLVDYSLRPFPEGLEDCFAAWLWIHRNAEKYHIDPTRLAVGGDSAGGALAAALCLMCRDRAVPPPCFQLLVYPVTDRRMSTASMAAFPHTPMWNSEKNRIMWQRYLKNGIPGFAEYASPMEAPSFASLPDAYVETAEFDCLRDEGIAYGGALKAAGSRVEFNITSGTCHGFELCWDAEPTQAAIDRRVAALKNAFYKKSGEA